jgi:hypothetical protein
MPVVGGLVVELEAIVGRLRTRGGDPDGDLPRGRFLGTAL